MIYDLMPKWLRRLLKMDLALLPTSEWTWRHTCRFGRDPAKTMEDYERFLEKMPEELQRALRDAERAVAEEVKR